MKFTKNNLKPIIIILVISIIFGVVIVVKNIKASYSQTIIVNNDEYVFEKDVRFLKTIKGASPLKIEGGMSFVNGEENPPFSIYIREPEDIETNTPTSTINSLIVETGEIHNPYKVGIVFWDKEQQNADLIINNGEVLRASVFPRSLMIGIGDLQIDSDYSKCLTHGAKYIDCSTDLTGGDLFVKDDIELGGDIYVQGDYYSSFGNAGLTNTSTYQLCTDFSGGSGICNSWCTFQIENGLIIDCI